MTEASSRNYAIKVNDTEYLLSVDLIDYSFTKTVSMKDAYRFKGKDFADSVISELYKHNKAIVAYKLET